ncbi:17.9 kDa heat shock protein 2-like [Lolium perenne]|uniref:17.9 kDa heat shock protein 2-like n=1 Tax=Lolium perenne TaxID=4522 RepID=UPI0021EA9963|nr:17.9 kDa heat shock protein 2-like [Lolium perenne]
MSLVARLFDTLSLDAWKNPFSSIFGTAAGADAWLASDTTAFAETYIETRETAEAYVFSARLPAGVSKEEVRVDVEEEGHVLVIAGQRSVRREVKSDEARRQVIERSCASFFGRFCLPEDAVVGQVRAAMDDGGELVVTVPRIGAAAVVALPEPALAIEAEASPC